MTDAYTTESKVPPMRVEDAVMAGLQSSQSEADSRAYELESCGSPPAVVRFMQAEAAEYRLIAGLYRTHLEDSR